MYNDFLLIRKMKQGDDNAFDLFVHKYYQEILSYCYHHCFDQTYAEDLTQEVFLRALQNQALMESFAPGQCKACLFAAARNLYCDQVRRAVKEESLLALLDPDDAETPDETAEAALGTVDLDSLLGTLDPLDKMLFTLRYEEGYNASELGQKFELPPGTVRTRLGKVRHLLKQKLLEE